MVFSLGEWDEHWQAKEDNPFHAEIIWENQHISIFYNILTLGMEQVGENFPLGSKGPTCIAKSISRLQMAWRLQEPGH